MKQKILRLALSRAALLLGLASCFAATNSLEAYAAKKKKRSTNLSGRLQALKKGYRLGEIKDQRLWVELAKLHDRGILYAPDFVITAGARIHGALFHLQGSAPAAERVRAIGATVGEILDRAAAEGVPPEQLADRIARERVAAGPGGAP